MAHSSNQFICISLGGLVEPKFRYKQLARNPHLADWYFSERLTAFVKHFFQDTLDYDWIWFRYEWQSRTAIHAHGVVRLKNDPGVAELVERVYKGRLSQEKLEDEETAADIAQDQRDALLALVRDGAEAERRVLSYVDFLQTAVNPRPPDARVRAEVPDPHPCSVDMSTVLLDPQKREEQYVELVNCVQKHVCRIDGYCKSSKKKGNCFSSSKLSRHDTKI